MFSRRDVPPGRLYIIKRLLISEQKVRHSLYWDYQLRKVSYKMKNVKMKRKRNNGGSPARLSVGLYGAV